MNPRGSVLRFHPLRDRLIAEAHARPSSPLAAPALATRIVTLSGEAGGEADREHMAALCEKLAQPSPSVGARWCLLNAGSWRLRWERHTEVSAWTVFRPGAEAELANFSVTALDVLPRDWLAGLPGEVMAAAHAAIVAEQPKRLPFAPDETVAAKLGQQPIWIYGDFRAGPDAFTRFVLVSDQASDAVIGRTLQQVFEVETYRLLALLAFPLAQETAETLKALESQVDQAAEQVVKEGNVASDRDLLNRLAGLAGEAEALAGRTNFRFSAAKAYYGLVGERIAGWHEAAVEGRPTVGEFMERRLAPAMRTCEATSDRQRAVLERIARTVQVLSTRVEVASEAVNVALLESMDRRSKVQLRLQQTVEGLSLVAISYYALALLKMVFDGASELIPGLNATVATAIAAPLVIYAVWRVLRRVRASIEAADRKPHGEDRP